MSTVSLVELPASRQPVFPDACCLCNRSRSEPLLPVAVSDDLGRVDLYLYGLPGKPAQGAHLQVPVHASCARGVRNRFLKHLTLALAVAAAVAALGFALDWAAWLCLSLAAVTFVPLLYPTLTRPVPFEFWQGRDSWFLAFQDRAYAERFARLNQVEVKEGAKTHAGRSFGSGRG